MFAPTFIANSVLVIGLALQVFGIHIAEADLQTTVVTIVTVAVPLFTMFRQWWTGRSTPFGTRPETSPE